MCSLLMLMWSISPMLLIRSLSFKQTKLCSLILSQISTRTQGLKTSLNTSKDSLFAMHSMISESHSTLSKYVSSNIPTLLTLMLKPLMEPLETVTLGLLSMQHPFKLLFFFLNQLTILKPLRKMQVYPFKIRVELLSSGYYLSPNQIHPPSMLLCRVEVLIRGNWKMS